MPKAHIETTFTGQDMSWLASEHGLRNARTYTLDAAKFATVQNQKGKVPAGYPVIITGEKLAPYTGTGDLAGHILFDVDARYGDVAVPVFYHGSVFASKLPVSFTKPATQPLTNIVYL